MAHTGKYFPWHTHQQIHTPNCLLHTSYKEHHINYIQTCVTKALVCFKKHSLLQAQSRFTDFISQQQLTRTGQMALWAHSQYSFCTLLRDEQIYSILPSDNSAPHLISVCILLAPKPWGSVEVGRQLTTQTDISHIVCPEKELMCHYMAFLCSISYVLAVLWFFEWILLLYNGMVNITGWIS